MGIEWDFTGIARFCAKAMTINIVGFDSTDERCGPSELSRSVQ